MATYQPIKPNSLKEDIRDFAVGMAVLFALYTLCIAIAQIIAAPFKILFMSDRQKLAARIKRAQEKIDARIALRAGYLEDPSNPFNQYVERFKMHPEAYEGDADNDLYKKWFEDFKNGKILDSNLEWAPELYVKDTYNKNMISVDFLDYLERQVNLHSVFNSRGLEKTLEKYYPEFGSKFETLSNEISDLREKTKARELHFELVFEVSRKGVSSDIAEELVSHNYNLEQLKEAIPTAQKCTEKNFSKEMCLLCLELGYDPDDSQAEAVNNILVTLNSREIATALIRGDIDIIRFNHLLDDSADENPDIYKDNILSGFERMLREDCHKQMLGRTTNA